MAQINVVPYIDVMLVLLVIFLVTAPLLKQGVKVDLPHVPSKPVSSQPTQTPLTVTVNAQGAFFVNQGANPTQALDAAALRHIAGEILSKHPKIQVYVRGDSHVSYGKVVEAMGILQQVGADKVGLVTEPPAADSRH
ncbi:protein TolR [Acidihalobacter prosperus]|uniref:Protein TolR n=1 Tax=Acidihalobacter prosperus TaxID=160660 RepID=A0A1A6C364_9GAMM|nr:protein TolR [Acidihalobacter prosperus]OBS09007.1 protein TolR [Acidihalobacter prosperus]